MKRTKTSIFLACFLFVLIFGCGAASAATINVNNSTPNAIGSAIGKASAGDTLNLTAGTYKEHDLVIDKDLTITGPTTTGTPTAVIDAQQQGRIFTINPGVTVTLKYLTIQNGAIVNDYGGGIYNAGNLTVNNCVIKQNTASIGGGICNFNTLTVNNSMITSNNAVMGGGMTTRGTCTVIGSTINDNIQNGDYGWGGGGIYINENGVLNVINSTINSNKAVNCECGGGGIFICNGAIVTFTNSTLKYNTSGNDGGAIYNITGELTVTGCDMAYNKANGNGNAIYTALNDSVTLNFNRFYDTETGYEVYASSNNVDAKYNWWGSNSSPANKVYGSVIVTPWLILKINATPTYIKNGSISKVTANLLYDSNGMYHNPTNGHVLDGLTINFTNTLNGINSPVSMVNGAANTTLTGSTVEGIVYIISTVDLQTVNTKITVDTKPPVVSTSNPTNGKTGVKRNQTITVTFNENIKAGSNYSKITLKSSTGKTITITKSISGKVLTIKHSALLSAKTKYTITLYSGSITDIAGNPIATKTITFTTGST